MKVYLCYEQYFDGCDFWPKLQVVFDAEDKAQRWEIEKGIENTCENTSFYYEEWRLNNEI